MELLLCGFRVCVIIKFMIMEEIYIVYSAYPHEERGSVDSVYQNPDDARVRMEEIELGDIKESWVCKYEVQ